MKTLSHLLIAALFGACLFTSSCKKDSTAAPVDAASSMKFTANGTDVSLNNCLQASASVNDVVETIISGANFTNGTAGDASFEVNIIHDPATLKAGQTYQMITSFGQATDGAILFYYTSLTDIFTTQPANAQGSVTITDVTSTTISGTFSGKLFASGDFSGTKVLYTITNGTFTAKRNLK